MRAKKDICFQCKERISEVAPYPPYRQTHYCSIKLEETNGLKRKEVYDLSWVMKGVYHDSYKHPGNIICNNRKREKFNRKFEVPEGCPYYLEHMLMKEADSTKIIQ